jgi:hypothetical protein
MWWRRLRYVLALIGLCAIATCPAARRSCTAHNRAREADQLLDYLSERVSEVVATTGKLPPVAAGPTPQPGCCDRGGACDPDDATWSAPGWRALGFSIDGDYRYTYSYTPDPSGASAVIRAVGDLDCDGESSAYEVHLVLVGGKLTRTDSRTRPYE